MNFNGIPNGNILFSSTNNCWGTLSSVLSCRMKLQAAAIVVFSWISSFHSISSSEGKDSVIKRIYSCFMKIVNSYFSITMIFSLLPIYILSSLPCIALMLFCGVGFCYVWMCLLVVHFSSSFDFTLHNMQNSFESSSFLSALNLNISRERWKISYKSGGC